MIYTFICREHPEYGGLGWKQKNQPGYDPLGGMAVAHDVMEHFPKGDESFSDELQAFGAMYHVRGEEYYIRKGRMHQNPGYHQSTELLMMLRRVYEGDLDLKPYPRHKLKNYQDHEIRQYLDEMVKSMRDSLEHEDPESRAAFKDHDVANPLCDLQLWMRYGYMRAKRRYAKVTRSFLLERFCKIENEADKYLKIAEPEAELKVMLKGNETRIWFDECPWLD